jgi:hypothetical protein
MIATLETLTDAGQRHLMTKVVALIEGHLAAAGPARERQTNAEVQLLGQLQRECERPSPGIAAFRDHAERLIALVARLG